MMTTTRKRARRASRIFEDVAEPTEADLTGPAE